MAAHRSRYDVQVGSIRVTIMLARQREDLVVTLSTVLLSDVPRSGGAHTALLERLQEFSHEIQPAHLLLTEPAYPEESHPTVRLEEELAAKDLGLVEFLSAVDAFCALAEKVAPKFTR